MCFFSVQEKKSVCFEKKIDIEPEGGRRGVRLGGGREKKKQEGG